MTKKLSFILIIVALLFGNITASARDVSFETAVNLLNEQSIALRIAELNLEIANLDYNRAVASNLMTDSEYSRLQAEHNLARAQNTYKTSKDSNFLEVFRKYTDVLAAERNVEIRQIEYVVAQHNYKVVQEKVRMGDASKLDDLRELNRLESAERTVESAKNTLAESIRALKSTLNLQAVDALTLTTVFALPKFELSLEQSLELALENSFDIWDRESSLTLQEMQLQKSRIDGTAPIDLKRAELNLEIARLNHERSLEDLSERITSSYQGLGQNRARYTSAQRELEIAKDSYAISKQQAEIGLITEIQLLESRLSLLRAESSLEDALVAYTISQIQFEQLIGMEVERP